MEKQIITFSANEQKLQKTSGIDCYASNTVAYIEARFDLGENWSGFDSVRAVWYNDYNKTVATVLDSDGTCVVPYEVLTRKSAVKVNLVGSIADGDVLTDRLTTCPVVALTIKCNAKTDGDNTQPITPSEYEQFVASVKTDADRAEAGATASEQSAQNASESATASANSASDSAQSATASAQSAQNASGSAQSAENAKDDAEDARDEILGMRATAETLEAGSDATASYSDGLLTLGIPRGDQGIQGIQGETGATPSFSIGTVETLAPTEDATATITGTAENPVLNLGLPKGDTGEVSLEDLEALLPTDTASGDIVTIPDGQSVIPAESLKVELEPIQDLNGYDKPWSGGAGKNKFGGVYGQKYELHIPNGATVTAYVDKACTLAYYEADGTTRIDYWSIYTEVAGGYTRTFTMIGDSSYFMFLGVSDPPTKMYIAIENSFSGYEPYSNICPISGHTECVTDVCGVNVWDEEWEVGGYSTANGEKATQTNTIRSTNAVSVIPNGNYYVGVFGTGAIYLFYYDANGNYVGNSGGYVSSGVKTIPSNAYQMRFQLNPSYGTTYNHDISINYPSTDTDYHAYDGDTYTTDLGRTVYGGTLDVVSGELVVDRAMVTFDGSEDESWLKFPSGSASAYAMRITNNDLNIKLSQSREVTAIANYLVGIGASATWGDYDGFVSTTPTYQNTIFAGIKSITTVVDWRAYLAQNPLQVVYELATPQTIQLTPQEVQLLLGNNNVWSDGSVTLVYNADIQLWVEKKLS